MKLEEHFVECMNCGAKMSDKHPLATGYSVTEKWNTRYLEKEVTNA